MATLTYFRNFDPIDDAYFDPSGNLTISVNSSSSTQVVLTNTSNGIVTTLTGTGFTFDPGGSPTGGTITSFSHQQGGTTLGTITGASISLVSYDQALGDIDTSGDYSAMAALISAQDLVVDATGSSEGVRFNGDSANGFVLTSNITIDGSPFSDFLSGGDGNDVIRPGDNDDSDNIFGSLGTDTIDFSGTHSANLQNYYGLDYSSFNNGITADIDGTANTGTISSAGSFDTLIDVNRVLDWDTLGVGVIGTNQADTFNYTMADETWIGINPGGGNDAINVTVAGEGTLRINYNWNGISGPSTGIVADLGAGVISNDGYGGSDTLNVSGMTFRPIELRGTDFADSMTGSAQSDSFISQGGNDFIDGAGGDNDQARYDRSGMTSGISVDLAAGTASGSWDSVAFTDTLVSIEEIRGTRDFGDTMFGDAMDNRLRGYGGDDYLEGRAGDDKLEGNEGNDTLEGGDGNDTLDGGTGDDTLLGQTGSDELLGGGGADWINGGAGSDVISGGQHADVLNGGGGGDIITGGPGNHADTIDGGAGSDQIGGGDGNDLLFGGTQADIISGGNGQDIVDGGQGNDTMAGGAGNDSVLGDAGLDVLIGGLGLDTLRGGNDGDTINGNGGDDMLFGDAGGDVLAGGIANDAVDGGADNDNVRGNAGDDTVLGGDGDDTMLGDGGNDLMAGGNGNDLLIGGVGNDTLLGQTGNDVLNSGGGDDIITGGTGTDRFVFVGGFDNDTITDFVEGLETVVLGGFTLADVSTSAAGNDLVLQVAGGGDITVVNGVTDGFDVGTDVFFA